MANAFDNIVQEIRAAIDNIKYGRPDNQIQSLEKIAELLKPKLDTPRSDNIKIQHPPLCLLRRA